MISSQEKNMIGSDAIFELKSLVTADSNGTNLNTSLTWHNINVYSPPLESFFPRFKPAKESQMRHIIKNGENIKKNALKTQWIFRGNVVTKALARRDQGVTKA